MNIREPAVIPDVQGSEDKRITWYVVESENFESIHNHSAYALIEKDKTGK